MFHENRRTGGTASSVYHQLNLRLVKHNAAAAGWHAELSLGLGLTDAEEQVVR